jgi:hypothetical protein
MVQGNHGGKASEYLIAKTAIRIKKFCELTSVADDEARVDMRLQYREVLMWVRRIKLYSRAYFRERRMRRMQAD